MLKIKIRKVKNEDASALAALFPHWDAEITKKRVERAPKSKREARYVAEIEDKVVAHLLVRFGAGWQSHIATFYSLVVHPDYRRKGIATELIKYAIKNMPKHIEIVNAQVQHDNKASLALFSKLGFEVYGRLKDGWKKEGVYKDLILLMKRIR